MVTCSDILSTAGIPPPSTDLVSACLQANATLQAARMQAEATTFAGWLTVGTGVTALVAAFIAYLAAGRQVRLSERQHQAKRKVYAILIHQTLREIADSAKEIAEFKFLPPDNFLGQDLDFAILSANQVVNDALSDRHWERHAMLDPDAAMLVVDVYTKGKAANSIIEAYGRERKYFLEEEEKRSRAIRQEHLSTYEVDIRNMARDLLISVERAMDGLKVDMQKP